MSWPVILNEFGWICFLSSLNKVGSKLWKR